MIKVPEGEFWQQGIIRMQQPEKIEHDNGVNSMLDRIQKMADKAVWRPKEVVAMDECIAHMAITEQAELKKYFEEVVKEFNSRQRPKLLEYWPDHTEAIQHFMALIRRCRDDWKSFIKQHKAARLKLIMDGKNPSSRGWKKIAWSKFDREPAVIEKEYTKKEAI